MQIKLAIFDLYKLNILTVIASVNKHVSTELKTKLLHG